LIIALLAVAVAMPGCASYTTIPVDYSMPVAWEGDVYDDIVPTPGGAAYRANVHQVGEENPWPPVETVMVELNGGWLRYRDHIETGAGETRNNIFTMGLEGGFWEGRLKLYASAVPPGIELSRSMGGGLPGTLATVLVIEIAPEVAPGQYILEIGLEVEGWDYGIVRHLCGNRDYGTFPCIIEVVE